MPELDDHDQQQVDLLICGGVVLPMTGADDLIWKGAVAVDGGKIVAVGADEELRRQFQPRRTIDASDQLVMPGLINTHMHLFGAFARGLVNDLSFTPWIQKKFYVTSSGLNPGNFSLSQPLWVGFPYVVALLVLAGARTSARMPSALAVAYRRGQR
jgi:hypothetical protein